MDKRKYNGAKPGEYRGQGRKPKADELALIEQLTPLDAVALKALEKGVKAGSFQFIKLFLEYRFGKPSQQVELKGMVEQPLFPPEDSKIDYSKLSTETLEEILRATRPNDHKLDD